MTADIANQIAATADIQPPAARHAERVKIMAGALQQLGMTQLGKAAGRYAQQHMAEIAGAGVHVLDRAPLEVTTHLKAGYLRKNGVPYSEGSTVTEYYDRHTEPNGDQWFTVTTIVEDPTYLDDAFITSSHFKKEPDGAKWHPTACSAQ